MRFIKEASNYDGSASGKRARATLVSWKSPQKHSRSLKIIISLRGLSEPLSGDGETITVNRHGALIVSSIPLRIAVRIEILVIRTRSRALAKVVYVDPDRPRVCGIALENPENIWGGLVPPKDWQRSS